MRSSYRRTRQLRKVDTVFLFDPRIHMNLTKTECNNLDLLDKYEAQEWMEEVNKLQIGDSFMIDQSFDNSIKFSPIVCLTKCYFAVLDHKDYEKILQKIENREKNDKVEFFKNIPEFNSITLYQIKKLIQDTFFKEKYSFGKLVYQ